ncbi:meiosis 1 arrest protein isoform X2 [Sceloporus undulatus]|uniref:meiosis 1 arrest protein isoform X2 n=1 Tax=Sceloporus undulatus TaxID=8520 RepID=UPI001C4CA599|nr:meiosis 1 arrest protein isoform X2 [Sceloporus undulatus]
MMSSGTKRMRDAGATDLGSQPATGSQPPPPPRILVVDARPPHWAQTCPKLCEALENLFCLACSLGGPPRLPLFSLYVAQRQHECLLPFMPVKGGFARLQSCLAELRAVPAEGAFRPGEEAAAVAQAVQDGLQQFKQYTGQGMAGATLSSCAIEVTVLTSQLSTEVARQLEMRLQGTDQVSLRQLQVVAIAPGGLQEVPTPAAGGSTSTHGTPVEEEEAAFAASGLLGPEVDLQTVENEVVALEGFFKAWLQDPGGEQEHLHLLLPAPLRGSLACLKCDIQERLLSPALLPPVGTNRDNVARANSVTTDCFWMAPGPGLAPHRLRVLRYPSGALRAEGLCASLLFGLPLIVRPTSCWRLNWDELEVNQHRFQALCRGLRNREWLLLARHEPQGESGPCRVPLATAPVASHWALLPAASCSSLLLRALAPQELLLPGPCPVLPADPPEAALRDMEGILEGLEVEMTFDPLCLGSHLYRALRTILARPLDPRPPLRLAERHLSRQASRQHPSRARATVAPLRLAPAGPNASRVALSLFSGEEEEFLDAI